MKSAIDILSQLGNILDHFGEDKASNSVILSAIASNEWYSRADIIMAVDAIKGQMLRKNKIENWLPSYTIPSHTPKSVAIFMAGNIPLVGFFDLMCVIVSGNIPYISYSSKDRILMQYIVTTLFEIEPQLQIYEYKNQKVDAVIATGGNSANNFFTTHFGNLPHIFRSSRHSVAVLNGKESREQLDKLSVDTFSYSGLGCRNISLIFMPYNSALNINVPKMSSGYNNNYLQTKALLTMNNVKFIDLNGAVAVENSEGFSNRLSQINIIRYSDIEQVNKWIDNNKDNIQCVVSAFNLSCQTTNFGMAQYPTLFDYADNIDTIKFLTQLC